MWERVADGTLSMELLERLCKEYYFLGKWSRSVEHVLVMRNACTAALNRWLDEPGARRS